MKQLSAMGARRQFFRNPRRLRALRPGEEFVPDGVDLLAAGHLGYFTGKYASVSAAWRRGATGRALDLRSVGRGFKSCSRQRCVTTLGKLDR